MPVNDALVNNWFFGNHDVRVVGALAFGFLMGSLPVGAVVRWLFADFGARTARIARFAIPLIDVVRGFVPIAIVAHGGGLDVGLGTGLAACIGECYSPWTAFSGGSGAALQGGIVLALSPPAAAILAAFWITAAATTGSTAAGTVFAAAAGVLPLWFFLGPAGAFYAVGSGSVIGLRQRSAGTPSLPAVERETLEALEI